MAVKGCGSTLTIRYSTSLHGLFQNSDNLQTAAAHINNENSFVWFVSDSLGLRQESLTFFLFRRFEKVIAVYVLIKIN